MFPRLAWLPLGLFVIWTIVCHHWYVCHIKMACQTEVQPPPPPPEPPAEDTRPLVFKWDDSTPSVRSTFEKIKAGKIAEVNENTLLEIVGHYFPDENAPEGFPNMGLARANKVAQLFIPPLKPEQIVETSQIISNEPPGIRGDTLFESVVFNVKDNTPVDTVEIVEIDGAIRILFPYGSSVREPDRRVDKYLAKLATRLKQTKETVSITGHTDDAGTFGFNMRLGMRRAEHIRDILVSKGIDSNRMTVDSKGESGPIASNATQEGTRQNRRVELVLNE